MSKVLVANRGEIACRIMRSAKAMGLRTVAVYSEVEADAPHVALADEALCIGAAPASASYLNIEALLQAARQSGADAIHPGYGFLSERADFAAACVAAGLVFIGPSAASIEAMGNKAAAKRRMLEAGVPCVPGYLGAVQDEAHLISEALTLGFPLLVKAVAGGGGRGMRTVHRAEELPGALSSARREAESAFGDGTLMLERLIEAGRHIEIQVFADHHGYTIHLGERDCSTQRRRQKVIEEAPSPVLSEAQRQAMGVDAVAAARAVGYVGAGTVEFMLDAQGRHYFLEMNTRLQVEHPVTEMITGLDLVEWQLRVAAGEPLPLRQEQVQFKGHAIEVRLYAEDPYDGFAPQTGTVSWWRPACAAAGLRVDSGIFEGGRVQPFYDPMQAKLIAHGCDRADAIRQLASALADSPLLGLPNNGRFLRDLLLHPDFEAARLNTASLDDWVGQQAVILQRPAPQQQDWLVAAGALILADGPVGPRPAGVASYALTLQCRDVRQHFRVSALGRHVTLELGGVTHQFEQVGEDALGRLRLRLNGHLHCCIVARQAGGIELSRDGAAWLFTEPSPYPEPADSRDPARALAPVAGVVAQILVRVGDTVQEGQPLLSVEAMKMEMWLTAGCTGRVKAIHAASKDSVAAGAVLVELDASNMETETP
ncbi:acetyl/propionyl/methylcrotonyl-CoA carboxylase subunit alpha [Roseateles koreensis]|uniref:Biotin carboxylase N-terminal domain-containing protein n=1 Tax=Roseateles koreensis TaxID=2987526 RepID=A0ABT5KUB7_9BURK|nr:biotin carboxylase N-terminal domain-containing protein [Roseateles koreensis]MDC8785421.1 biotin carboxylase N-terminal domain-containing protein [Roseateles koreensis]